VNDIDTADSILGQEAPNRNRSFRFSNVPLNWNAVGSGDLTTCLLKQFISTLEPIAKPAILDKVAAGKTGPTSLRESARGCSGYRSGPLCLTTASTDPRIECQARGA
jgi:hypothetical protein